MIYVIINNSGKTAGMSLYKSFKKLPHIKVQHTHNITRNDEPGRGFMQGKCVIEEVQNLKSNPRNVIYIFNVYRDIIERKISSFFQNLEFHMKMSKEDIVKKYKNDKNIDFIIERFNNMVYLLEEYNSYEQWEHLDFDVYKNGCFNKTKGVLVHQNENVIFVILAFSKIKKWKNIIDSELNNKKFIDLDISHSNNSKKKWYCEIYKQFNKKINIPHTTLDKIFEKHKKSIEFFMTDKEILDMKKKWYKK